MNTTTMNTTTQQALNPITDRDTLDREALVWIAMVVTAITILVSGAFVVRQVNAEQAEQATRPADAGIGSPRSTS